VLTVVGRFEFGGRDVAAGLERASVVEPVDVLEKPRSGIDEIADVYRRRSVGDPDQVVSAQCILGRSDSIAAGATVGVTTRRLTARTGDRASLDEVVVSGCRTSREVGELDEQLCGSRGGV
jgi:hypothetical protein